jgi:hypothetical protein
MKYEMFVSSYSSGDHPYVYLAKFGNIQNMKIDILKHPFVIFGDFKIKMCFLDNLTKRKGSLFALTFNPYDFLNLFLKHLTFEHKQQK